MIHTYCRSVQGTLHAVSGTQCQDWSGTERIDERWYLAVVSDGVGSAPNSAAGSRIAGSAALGFCREHLPHERRPVALCSLIMLAFEHALGAVAREARRSGEPLETYDTTLTLGLYDAQERRLYYGHAGDSGIVGITADGATIPVTVAHHGEDGTSVIPLRFGCDTWEIGVCKTPLVGVLLATDGVLAALRPYLLRCGDPLPDESETVYTPLALWLADPAAFTEDDARGAVALLDSPATFSPDAFWSRLRRVYEQRLGAGPLADELLDGVIRNGWAYSLLRDVYDDRSVAAIVNADAALAAPRAWTLAEPDWGRLKRKWDARAYPSMVQEPGEQGEEAPATDGCADAGESDGTASAPGDATPRPATSDEGASVLRAPEPGFLERGGGAGEHAQAALEPPDVPAFEVGDDGAGQPQTAGEHVVGALQGGRVPGVEPRELAQGAAPGEHARCVVHAREVQA